MLSENGMIIFIFVITTIISYITFTPILGLDNIYIKNHLNKIYGSILIGLIVGLTELVVNYEKFTTLNFLIWILFFVTTILILYYLIIQQVFVSEKEYLYGLIESHGVDLKMSQKLLEHNNLSLDTRVLVDNLIKTRDTEEKQINHILKKIK